MLCSSFKNNGAKCTFKAKYAINYEDDRVLTCKIHVLKEARQLIDEEIKNIEDAPDIIEITDIKKESDKRNDLILQDALTLIKATTNLDIKYENEMTIKDFGIEYQVRVGHDDLILTICSTNPVMTDMYEAMCVQFETRKCNAFMPIQEYESFGRKYFISKMVHTSLTSKEDTQKIKLPYFYQIHKPSTPLRDVSLETESLMTFISHMCDLIERLHISRMCFGDFNVDSLVFLDSNDPTTAFISSARNISFWINSQGDFKSEERTGSGTRIPLTASRRVHAKHAPSRYDDFESLLYLVLTLQGKLLPWNESTSMRDSEKSKTSFLKDPEECFGPNESLARLCSLIINAEFEERPIYKLISDLFLEAFV